MSLLIPPQISPYKVSLKTRDDVSLMSQRGPLRQCQNAPNAHETCTTSPRRPRISEASPKRRVRLARDFEGMFLYPRNVPTQNFSPIGAGHRRPFKSKIRPVTSKRFQFFSQRGFTTQTTSDWPEILCGFLIPPHLPYKISLKTHEPISLCPREVPSDSAKTGQMPTKRARRPHDAPAFLKHLPNGACALREILRRCFYTRETFPHKISAQSELAIDDHSNPKFCR